jgi:ABC-type proline/glycine betaine transport system permease subunit
MAIRVTPEPCRVWCRRHYYPSAIAYACAFIYAVGLRLAAAYLHMADPPIWATASVGFCVYWLAVLCARMALFDRRK